MLMDSRRGPRHHVAMRRHTPQRRSSRKTLRRQSKIALFRRRFAGREDVFPIRWENLKTGKSGYAPACYNEWKPGICQKPRIRTMIVNATSSCTTTWMGSSRSSLAWAPSDRGDIARSAIRSQPVDARSRFREMPAWLTGIRDFAWARRWRRDSGGVLSSE